MKENTKKPTLSSDKHGDSVLLRGKFKPNGLGSFIEMVVQSSKLILCNCDPCSKHAPIDDSGAINLPYYSQTSLSPFLYTLPFYPVT
jgi:hypothetical protein